MEYNKERFKKYFFEYDCECSYDFYIDIINCNNMDKPAQIIEQVRVPGASRDTFYSEGTYENKVIDIECYVDVRHDIKRKDIHIKKIKQWLGGKCEYKKLKFSDDEGYYDAVCISNMLFEEVVEGLYRTLISFNCAPYKNKAPKVYTLGCNEEVECVNEGFISSPFKIKIEYPDAVSGFSLVVKQDNNELYNFNCNAPASGTKCLEIYSEDYKVTAYNESLSSSSAINIVNTIDFPYAPVGYSNIIFKADNNLVKATVEFIEMEL